MKKIILYFALGFFLSSLSAQTTSFYSHFRKIELPFITKDDSFDLYHSNDPYIFSENELNKFLISKSDSFLIEKNNLNIVFNTNYDYFTVGQFTIDNGVNCFLYYRNYIEKGPEYTIELILITLNQEMKVICSLPVSILYTKKDIFSDCKIDIDGNILINYFSSSTQKFLKTEKFTIDKDGMINITP